MQQFCSSCGSPITAGMTACARCGTPVSGGAGAYDPTVRSGTPPGSAYGSQPYGPPPSDPYGAPPPPPGFGGPPQPSYSAPTQQSYGAPPPPPGFGGPPQPGYPGPQPQFMPPQQPKKSRTWIYVVGGILVVLILICGAGLFALKALGNAVTNTANNLETAVSTITVTSSFQQTVTTGTHITQVQTGTGFDQNTGLVEGEQSTFTTSDQIWIVYTVTDPDPDATVTLTLEPLDQTANAPQLDTQTSEYANQILNLDPGTYTVNLDYNGTQEASINFQVTSD